MFFSRCIILTSYGKLTDCEKLEDINDSNENNRSVSIKQRKIIIKHVEIIKYINA